MKFNWRFLNFSKKLFICIKEKNINIVVVAVKQFCALCSVRTKIVKIGSKEIIFSFLSRRLRRINVDGANQP